jgi:hypothetical protein
MNDVTFDSLTRALIAPRSRRGLLQLVLALGAAGSLGRTAPAAARKGRKSCGPCEKRKKNGHCRPHRDGTRCRSTGYCDHGRCHDCRDLKTPCQDDFQCCSGVCDRYTGTCQTQRTACAPKKDKQCVKGLCCPDASVEPTGYRCSHNTLTNRGDCGTRCANLENCGNIVGSTACQNGKCCCLEATCTRSSGEPVPPCAT